MEATSPAALTQQSVLTFLADPRAHGGAAVQRVETHCSVVFLVGGRALKVKRAVRYPYLDYSTLALRHAACAAELAVNQAIAPSLYTGIVAITRDAQGRLSIGGTGSPVEWAVDMRRFDPHCAFDVMADRGLLTADLLDATADVIAAMHQRAEVRVQPEQSTPLAHIVVQNNDLLRSLATDALNSSRVEAFAHAAVAEAARIQDLLFARRQVGKVRRCHGDLHLRNLCVFEGKPTPFDAIEFDERLATIDVLYDLAFLLMDLWGRGLRDAANRVFNRYLERTEELDGLAALPLFLATRDAIRVHVTLTAAAQQELPKRQNLRDAAAGYFALARSLLEHSQPQLVVIGGLSGTGKTVQSRRLAPALTPAPGAVVLRSDVMRKRMMGVEPTTRLPADSYRPAVTAQVYAQLARDARTALTAGHSVIVDAVCARAEERDAFRALADAAGARFAGVWLEAPLSVRVDRIGTRLGDASDATGDVAARQEGIDVGDMRWRRVPAGGPAETTAAAVRAAVEG